MNQPKLHHFVPRFHLKRFADLNGRTWAWDKTTDKVIGTTSSALAAQNGFYLQPDLAEAGFDPLTLEKQFASLEDAAATITSRWLHCIGSGNSGDLVECSEDDRKVMALFLALQILRTADTRELLSDLAWKSKGSNPSTEEARRNHLALLWDSDIVDGITARLSDLTWVFAKNGSSVPLVTSDNPVAFRSTDNRMWLKILAASGAYMAYALSPDTMMYGYPREGRFGSLRGYNCKISPVSLSDEMVQDENTAHVFLASRHVISKANQFEWAREFKTATAEGRYAPRQGQTVDEA